MKSVRFQTPALWTLTLVLLMVAGVRAAHAQQWMTRTGRVTFFSSTKIENIQAVNNEAAVMLDAVSGEVTFLVPIKSFRFKKALMQEHFNENYMESDRFPKSTFKGKVSGAFNLNQNGTYPVAAAGVLSIHGLSQQVTVPGNIVVQDGKARIEATFVVAPKDYGIKIPALARASISDKIRITIQTELQRVAP